MALAVLLIAVQLPCPLDGRKGAQWGYQQSF